MSKFAEIKKLSLTPQQREIMWGLMLGDGGVYRRKHNINWSCNLTHSIKQQEYFLWKFTSLQPFFHTYRQYLRKSGKIELCSDSLCHPEFKFWGELFYHHQIKIIPDHISLTPLSLAVWVMDDGKLGGNNTRIELCTCSFTILENQKLQQFLFETFKFSSQIRFDRQYPILTFNTETSKKLSQLIHPYVLPSLQYKLLL